MDATSVAGLCATCRNVRIVHSDRGAVFYRCELAKTDPRFPKYPRLPVLACDGYSQREADRPGVRQELAGS